MTVRLAHRGQRDAMGQMGSLLGCRRSQASWRTEVSDSDGRHRPNSEADDGKRSGKAEHGAGPTEGLWCVPAGPALNPVSGEPASLVEGSSLFRFERHDPVDEQSGLLRFVVDDRNSIRSVANARIVPRHPGAPGFYVT